MKRTKNGAVERVDAEKSDDRLQVFLHQQRYEFALERIAKEDTVLEIGTGMGNFSQVLAQHCMAYTGIEIEAAACQATRDRLQGRGRVMEADAQALPFEDGAYSAVVCLEVLEHLADYRRAVNEIGRCLKPGGRAVISVPYRRHGSRNSPNRFHLYEPGEEELVEAFAAHFGKVERHYQYFEETGVMTVARILRLRRVLGLAGLYRGLSMGEPEVLKRVRIGKRGKGLMMTLLLVASER